MWLQAVATKLKEFKARRGAARRPRRRRHRVAAAESPPLRLSWRVEELLAPKNRLDLAHILRSLVRESSARYLPSASPINRVAVRAEADTLLAIAARLADLDRPVAARGVVYVDRMLVDGSGPLYDRELVDDLPAYLDTVIEALEPR